MIYHQLQNSLCADNYNAYFYRDRAFEHHFHKNLEIIYVLEGQVDCTVNNRSGVLRAGEFGMCLPWEIHAYRPTEGSRYWVCVFSSDYVPGFSTSMEHKTGDSFRFACSEEVQAFFARVLVYGNTTSRYLRKACLYAACDAYLNCVKVVEQDKKMTRMAQIIGFVEENHTRDIRLSEVATFLGYEYHYVSRCFKSLFNMTFNDFLNTYRLETAVRLLQETDRKIADISCDSGFQSVRAFNDAFRAKYHMRPSEYRKLVRE